MPQARPDPWAPRPSPPRGVPLGVNIVAAAVAGVAGPVAYALHTPPDVGGQVVAALSIALALAGAVALRTVVSPRVALGAVVLVALAGVGLGRMTSLGNVASAFAVVGALVAIGALIGWGRHVAAGLAVPLVIAAQVGYGFGYRRVAVVVVMVAAVVVVCSAVWPTVAARPVALGARITELVSAIVATVIVATASIPLLYLPGLIGRVAHRLADPTGARSRQPRWTDRATTVIEHRRDAPYPFATTLPVERRRRYTAGSVGLAVVLLALAVVTRNDPPYDRAAAPSTTEGSRPASPPVSYPPLSHRAAYRGVTWADQLDVEYNEMSAGIRASPAGGFEVANFHSTYTNVTDQERKTYEAACTCKEPVVWFVGGSVAFGLGQRDLHTIPSDLARLAEQAGAPIEVHNLGVPAFTAVQELELMSARLDAASKPPDLIVTYDGFNDALSGFLGYLDGSYRVGRPEVLVEGPTDTMHQPKGFPVQSAAAMAKLGTEVARTIRATMAQEDALAAAHRVPILHVLQADPFGSAVQRTGLVKVGIDAPDSAFVNFGQMLDHVERGLLTAPGFLDLRHVLDALPTQVFVDVIHTNERAAALVARAMYPSVARRL